MLVPPLDSASGAGFLRSGISDFPGLAPPSLLMATTGRERGPRLGRGRAIFVPRICSPCLLSLLRPAAKSRLLSG